MARELDPSELKQIEALLAKARHYAGADPEVSLGQTRKAAEAIARAVFAREVGEPGKIMLDAMLQKLGAQKVIPPGVLVPFGTIQTYGNYGAHAQADVREIDERYVAPAHAALDQVARWFFAEYLALPEVPAAPPGAKGSGAGGPAGTAPAAGAGRRWAPLLAAAVVAAVVIALVLGRREAPTGQPPAKEPLELAFGVTARVPGEAAPRTLRGGEALFAGTELVFGFKPAAPAHIYLVQRTGATGQLNVLFPDERIPVKNPVPAGEWVRIPQGRAAFQLDDADLGTETVYVVASPTPVDRLDQALAGLRASATSDVAERELLLLAAGGDADCAKTRGLRLETEAAGNGGCTDKTRGIALVADADVPAAGTSASLRRVARSADGLLFIPFSFEHVRAPR